MTYPKQFQLSPKYKETQAKVSITNIVDYIYNYNQ